MLEFSKNLQRLIGMNKLEQAIDEFQNVLDKFNPETESAKIEQRDLRTAIIACSQRLYLVKEKELKGSLSDDEIMRERRALSNQYLDIINDLDKYSAISEYLNMWDDEQAWKKTNSLNAIDAYKEYLSKYPNGKYADDAGKYISMLQAMEEQKMKERIEERSANPAENKSPRQQSAENNTIPKENSNALRTDTEISNHGETISNGLNIALIIGTVFIPLIGLGAGAYFYFSKNGASYKYEDSSRKKGRLLMIIGGVMAFIYLIYYS